MTVTTHQTHTTSTDGTRLAVYTSGHSDNPPLVMVHGFPDNHSVWQPLMAALSDHYYLITYDVRGTGQSDTPKAIEAYQIEQMVEDMLSVADSVIADAPFHLIGHDWGSIQCWEAVSQSRLQGRIRTFTSLSGPNLDYVTSLLDEPTINWVDKLNQLKSSWYIYAFHVPIANRLLWRYIQQYWTSITKLPNDEQRYQDGSYGIKLYQANMLPKQRRPNPRPAICPVHLIVQTEDAAVTPVVFSGLYKWVNDLTRSELPYGHWGIYHHADTMATVITEYLSAYYTRQQLPLSA